MALSREEIIKQKLREKAAQRRSGAQTSVPTPKPEPFGSDFGGSGIDEDPEEDGDGAFSAADRQSMANDIFNDIFGEDSSTDGDASFCEEEIPPTRASYSTDKDGSTIFDNLRHGQKRNVFRIPPEVSVSPEPTSFFKKHKRKLIETHIGMSYMYKECFEQYLDAGIECLKKHHNMSSARDIRKVVIADGMVRLQNLELDPVNMTSGAMGTTIYDFIEYETLFKKFPMMQFLGLDAKATEVLTLKYGEDSETLFREIFLNKCKQLQLLEITVGSEIHKIGRNKFSAEATKKALGKSKMRLEIDQVAAALNPKKDRMTKAEKHRVATRDNAMKKFNWGPAKEFGIRTAKNIGKLTLVGMAGLAVLSGHFIIAGVFGAAIKSVIEMKGNK